VDQVLGYGMLGKGKGKKYLHNLYNYYYDLLNSGDHFGHSFGSIGSTGAEIEVFQNLYNLYNFYNNNDKNNNLIIARDQIQAIQIEVKYRNKGLEMAANVTPVLLL
jgi:hypothetical protein